MICPEGRQVGMRAIRKFHTPEEIPSIPLPADNL